MLKAAAPPGLLLLNLNPPSSSFELIDKGNVWKCCLEIYWRSGFSSLVY